MPRIKTVDKITPEILTELFNQTILALRVPNYINADLCDALAQWFINAEKLEGYPNDVMVDGKIAYIDCGVDRLGVSYNVTFNKNACFAEHKRYYENALATIREIREACHGKLSPVDKLRLELDENWPHGAHIASFDKKNMTVGIGRVMNRPDKAYMSELQPHIDLLPPHVSEVVEQYSANIYLSMPADGGELELWDIPPVSAHEALTLPDDYNWRKNYPGSIIITPQKGELILIHTRRPHAIHTFSSGNRVSQQCFIGMREDHRLLLWS